VGFHLPGFQVGQRGVGGTAFRCHALAQDFGWFVGGLSQGGCPHEGGHRQLVGVGARQAPGIYTGTFSVVLEYQ